MDNTKNIVYCRKISFINYFCHADETKLFAKPVRAMKQHTKHDRSRNMSNNVKNVILLKAVSSKLNGKLSFNFFQNIRVIFP